MSSLLLQLSLPAALIAGATGAQRRWGPRVGGLVTGLPLTSVPLLLLITLAHGPAFAGRTATAGLEGTAPQAVMLWVLAIAALRLRPLAAAAVSVAVFGAVVGVLATMPAWPALFGALAGAGAFGGTLAAWPRREARGVAPTPRLAGDLAARMGLASLFALAMTEASGVLGAHLAGLVSALPALAVVMAVLTARTGDGPSAAAFLRGVTAGSFATVSALAVLAVLLPAGHVLVAFAGATAVAAVTQLVAEGGRSALRHRRAPLAVAGGAAGPLVGTDG